MPIYEYECDGCQTVHEVVQKMSDAPLETCPTCGGKVKKLISLSSFHLKGTGWYNTDYKKKPTAASAAESTSAPKAAETPAVKAETPASTPSPAPTKPKAS